MYCEAQRVSVLRSVGEKERAPTRAFYEFLKRRLRRRVE